MPIQQYSLKEKNMAKIILNNNLLAKILVVVTYLAMVIVNALANILPINGTTTGDVSNAYGNLFAPTALTFSIWGIIYFLLAAYTLYQFGLFQKDKGSARIELFSKIGIYFTITSLANMLWIFSWHYDLVGVSVILMAILLFGLIKMADILRKEQFSLKEEFFIRAPFSVYFGWIMVATIANITTFLVSIGWKGFGISDQVWASVILIVGAIIGITRMLWDKNIFYGLVFIWAYIGILIKHTSSTGFAGQYTSIITIIIFCILAFVISEVWIFLKGKGKLSPSKN